MHKKVVESFKSTSLFYSFHACPTWSRKTSHRTSQSIPQTCFSISSESVTMHLFWNGLTKCLRFQMVRMCSLMFLLFTTAAKMSKVATAGHTWPRWVLQTSLCPPPFWTRVCSYWMKPRPAWWVSFKCRFGLANGDKSGWKNEQQKE